MAVWAARIMYDVLLIRASNRHIFSTLLPGMWYLVQLLILLYVIVNVCYEYKQYTVVVSTWYNYQIRVRIQVPA